MIPGYFFRKLSFLLHAIKIYEIKTIFSTSKRNEERSTNGKNTANESIIFDKLVRYDITQFTL